MACFLAISDAANECFICGDPVPAGLVGHSDDLPPRPICDACLAGRDGRLTRVLILIEGMRAVSCLMNPGGDPERLAREVRELLGLIKTCLPPRGRG